MKYLAADIRSIDKFQETLKGVFSNADLSIILNSNYKQLFDRIRYLIKNEALLKATRGFYVTPKWDPQVLAQRINPESYISGPTILAEQLLIGTIPQNKVYSVKKGNPKEYRTNNIILQFNSISPNVYMGFAAIDGIKKATPEKALLDTLYFYQSGERYFFNIYQDISVSSIDQEVFLELLDNYNNPKFKAFAHDYITKRY